MQGGSATTATSSGTNTWSVSPPFMFNPVHHAFFVQHNLLRLHPYPPSDDPLWPPAFPALSHFTFYIPFRLLSPLRSNPLNARTHSIEELAPKHVPQPLTAVRGARPRATTKSTNPTTKSFEPSHLPRSRSQRDSWRKEDGFTSLPSSAWWSSVSPIWSASRVLRRLSVRRDCHGVSQSFTTHESDRR
jgi:hypothetical protein